MFFVDERLQYFKPLTSKYREQVIECLRLLYLRLYSADADYGHSLNREQLLEISGCLVFRACCRCHQYTAQLFFALENPPV